VPRIRCATRLAVRFVFVANRTTNLSICALMRTNDDDDDIWKDITSEPSCLSSSYLCTKYYCFVFFFWKIYTLFFSFSLALCVFFLFKIVHFTQNFFSIRCVRACVCQAVRLKNKNLNLDKSIYKIWLVVVVFETIQ